MNSKKGNFFVLILVSMLVFVNFSLVQTEAHEGNEHTIAPSFSTWNLTDWNENVPITWYSKGINVSATIGSTLSYNVTHENEGNISYPNSGFLAFGNVHNVATDNNDIALLLALSIYPWAPGLLTSTANWTQTIEEAQSVAKTSQFLKGSLTVTKNVKYEFQGQNRFSVKFEFVQDVPGNQNTTLIYDTETGLLLFGHSEFQFNNLYKIGLKLESTTLIEKQVVSSPGFDFLPVSLVLTIVSFIGLVKVKRNS